MFWFTAAAIYLRVNPNSRGNFFSYNGVKISIDDALSSGWYEYFEEHHDGWLYPNCFYLKWQFYNYIFRMRHNYEIILLKFWPQTELTTWDEIRY